MAVKTGIQTSLKFLDSGSRFASLPEMTFGYVANFWVTTLMHRFFS